VQLPHDKPKAFIFAGANASGKSTFITHLLNNNILNGEYINPDNILFEKKLGYTKENYLSIGFPEAERRRNDAVEHNKDFIMETVFSTDGKVNFVEDLLEKGYHVTVFFTGTSSHYTNAIYLTARVEGGGHDVPIAKLITRREKGFKNIAKFISRNICLIFVDNSVIEEPPTIVSSYTSGIPCYVNTKHDREEYIKEWLNPITNDIATSDDVKIPEEIYEAHREFCTSIQEKSSNFEKTLQKDFTEKSQILSEQYV
jgi:predicted ABC-type ATPase